MKHTDVFNPCRPSSGNKIGSESRVLSILPWILLAFYALFLLVTLEEYGVTWDEPGWFNFGLKQWNWILHGCRGELKDPKDYFHYGALPSLVAAASEAVFHQRLGWLSSDSSFHLANIFFALLIAGVMALWGKEIFGNVGASAALLLWLLLPRLWPHAHNNINDIPGAAGCLLAAWSSWRLSRRPRARVRDWILWGLAMGLAYSLRAPNVYFLMAALILWAGWSRFALGERWRVLRWWSIPVSLIGFFSGVKALNPFLWKHSAILHVLVNNPKSYLDTSIGKLGTYFAGTLYPVHAVPRWYAWWTFIIATPILHLVLGIICLVIMARSPRRVSPALWLWFFLWVTAVGKHLIGMGNYDGERHFLEGYAPFCLLAASGALFLKDKLRSTFWITRWAVVALILAGVAHTLAVGIRVHPFQSGFFSPLAGKLSRAWNNYEVDYWGESFTAAKKWLAGNSFLPADHPPRLHVFSGHELAKYVFGDSAHAVHHVHPPALESIPPGEIILVMRRWLQEHGLRWEKECPPGWTCLHLVRPKENLPPLLYICRRNS